MSKHLDSVGSGMVNMHNTGNRQLTTRQAASVVTQPLYHMYQIAGVPSVQHAARCYHFLCLLLYAPYSSCYHYLIGAVHTHRTFESFMHDLHG